MKNNLLSVFLQGGKLESLDSTWVYSRSQTAIKEFLWFFRRKEKSVSSGGYSLRALTVYNTVW